MRKQQQKQDWKLRKLRKDKKGWKKEQKDSKQKDEKYFENCEKTTGNKVRDEYEEGS